MAIVSIHRRRRRRNIIWLGVCLCEQIERCALAMKYAQTFLIEFLLLLYLNNWTTISKEKKGF